MQSSEDSFYREADCFVLIYDVTAPKTFLKLDFWKDDFQKSRTTDTDQIPIVLLGNKVDLKGDRKVFYFW